MHTTADKDPDGSIRMGAVGKIMVLLNDLIQDRLANPRDDIAGTIVTAPIDGEPMPREHVLQMAFLLYMGGLDTVAGELGCFFRHFALHPEDRQFGVDHPESIPDVVEELLRAYSIVNTGRIVTGDAEWNGCPMKQGDRTFFNRERNRHMAFGAGPHRCLASYLAPAELAIALEEWHRCIPSYSLADGEPLGFHAGGLRARTGCRWSGERGALMRVVVDRSRCITVVD
jgi:cytochrome P450